MLEFQHCNDAVLQRCRRDVSGCGSCMQVPGVALVACANVSMDVVWNASGSGSWSEDVGFNW